MCTARAQSPEYGFHDSSFGTQGVLKIAVPNAGQAFLIPIDVQRDDSGRTWVMIDVPPNVSESHIGIVRLLPNGEMDAGFSGDGFLAPSLVPLNGETLQGVALARQTDGKLLIAGQRSIPNALNPKPFVCRLNASGSLDTEFGEQGCAKPILGIVDNAVESMFTMRLRGDGRIVLVGSTQVNSQDTSWRGGFVIRLDSDGMLDASLGGGTGWQLVTPPAAVRTGLTDVAFLPDGSMLVTGRDIDQGAFAAKRRSNGDVDTSWGNLGWRSLDVSDLHQLPNAAVTSYRVQVKDTGELTVCASLNYMLNKQKSLISAFRLDASGALETQFSEDGRFLSTFEDVYDVASVIGCHWASDGTLTLGLTVGTEVPAARDYALMRLTPDGHQDPILRGIGRMRYPFDLGGQGIGNDILMAIHVQDDETTLVGVSYFDNSFNVAAGTLPTVIRISDERLLVDGFEAD